MILMIMQQLEFGNLGILMGFDNSGIEFTDMAPEVLNPIRVYKANASLVSLFQKAGITECTEITLSNSEFLNEFKYCSSMCFFANLLEIFNVLALFNLHNHKYLF